MPEVHQFERIKLCVAMVTMWPKRQQSDIKFYTKNEFIKISLNLLKREYLVGDYIKKLGGVIY